MSKKQDAGAERVWSFLDAIFAVIITILVLELKPPDAPTWDRLLTLWPTGVSYALSYTFIAIVWMNHHHLMRCASSVNPRLIWANFAHLFCVSLIPFATAWMAASKLAAVPVSVYAALFALINLTYIVLCAEAIDRSVGAEVAPQARRIMRMRALLTLAVFLVAAGAALWNPTVGFGLVCFCLVTYLWPDAGHKEEEANA